MYGLNNSMQARREGENMENYKFDKEIFRMRDPEEVVDNIVPMRTYSSLMLIKRIG
jgi:hypothetical protein